MGPWKSSERRFWRSLWTKNAKTIVFLSWRDRICWPVEGTAGLQFPHVGLIILPSLPFFPPFFLYKHVYGVATLRQAGTVLEDKGISKTFTSPAFLVTWEGCRLLEPSILKLPARLFWTLSDPRKSSAPRESQPIRAAASVHTEHFSPNETMHGENK